MSTMPPVSPSADRPQSRMVAIVGPTATAGRGSRLSRLSSDVSVNLVSRSAHADIRRRTASASRTPAAGPSDSRLASRWMPTCPPMSGAVDETRWPVGQGSRWPCARWSWRSRFARLLGGDHDDPGLRGGLLLDDCPWRGRLARCQLDVPGHVLDRGRGRIRRHLQDGAGRIAGSGAGGRTEHGGEDGARRRDRREPEGDPEWTRIGSLPGDDRSASGGRLVGAWVGHGRCGSWRQGAGRSGRQGAGRSGRERASAGQWICHLSRPRRTRARSRTHPRT